MFTCRCTHVESKKMDFLFYDFSIIYYDFSKIQSKCKKKTKTPTVANSPTKSGFGPR